METVGEEQGVVKEINKERLGPCKRVYTGDGEEVKTGRATGDNGQCSGHVLR